MKAREIIIIVAASNIHLIDEAMKKEAKRLNYTFDEPEPLKITARPTDMMMKDPIITLNEGPIGAIIKKGRKRW